MKRLILLPLALCAVGFLASAQDLRTVERKASTTKMDFEHIIAGHLKELNGKYKIRVSENTYGPGGYIGNHQHVGPGVRYIVSGELTYMESDSTRIYRPGEYFFEPGDITHKAFNRGDVPVVILNFDLLPADWNGPTAVTPDYLMKK